MTREEHFENFKQHFDGSLNDAFLYGMAVADAHPVSPWISVKDSLPLTGDKVLVEVAEGIKILYLDYPYIKSSHPYWFNSKGESRLVQDYEWWMPIPKREKEQ